MARVSSTNPVDVSYDSTAMRSNQSSRRSHQPIWAGLADSIANSGGALFTERRSSNELI